MSAVMKVNKEEVRDILSVTYPDYRGKKLFISVAKTYHLSDYWSGGSRSYAAFAKWNGSRWSAIANPHGDPFKKEAHQTFEIPDDVIVVEHRYSSGKDAGIRFYISPGSVYLPKAIACGGPR